MRASVALFPLPLLALAACGGGGGAGPTTLGSVAPVANVSGGSGSGSGSATATPANLFDVTAETNFDAVGGLASYTRDDTKHTTLYQGDAGSETTPSGTVTYNPRDGIFTLALADTNAGVTRTERFQDPGHRTDASGSIITDEAPVLANYNYLEVHDPVSDTDVGGYGVFFYQRPGVRTSYVTLAGFAHASYDPSTLIYSSEHGAFVFGSKTPLLQVPTRGTGSYSGDFLATMMGSVNSPAVFQWINGTSQLNVDFGAATVNLALNGTVTSTTQLGTDGNVVRVNDQTLSFPTGTVFAATASGTIGGLNHGFSGSFSSATMNGASLPITKVNGANSTAGASSLDGAFYGPNAAEAGGSFRIVGGAPDQRIDIQGGFTGRR